MYVHSLCPLFVPFSQHWIVLLLFFNTDFKQHPKIFICWLGYVIIKRVFSHHNLGQVCFNRFFTLFNFLIWWFTDSLLLEITERLLEALHLFLELFAVINFGIEFFYWWRDLVGVRIVLFWGFLVIDFGGYCWWSEPISDWRGGLFIICNQALLHNGYFWFLKLLLLFDSLWGFFLFNNLARIMLFNHQ